MGTSLVGEVRLANGERVFVVWWTAEMNETTLANAERLRTVTVTRNDTGERLDGLNMLSFELENGVGVFLDVSVLNEDQER